MGLVGGYGSGFYDKGGDSDLRPRFYDVGLGRGGVSPLDMNRDFLFGIRKGFDLIVAGDLGFSI